jgi:hypothetical protein
LGLPYFSGNGFSVCKSRKVPLTTGRSDADPMMIGPISPFTGEGALASRSSVARSQRSSLPLLGRPTMSLVSPAAKVTLSSSAGT